MTVVTKEEHDHGKPSDAERRKLEVLAALIGLFFELVDRRRTELEQRNVDGASATT